MYQNGSNNIDTLIHVENMFLEIQVKYLCKYYVFYAKFHLAN